MCTCLTFGWTTQIDAADTAPNSFIDYSSQDAWALGLTMWLLMSPDSTCHPFSCARPRDARDELYVDPADASVDAAHASIARVVRELLRLRTRERFSLAEAVLVLEVALFVLPGVSDGVSFERVVDRLRAQASARSRGSWAWF